MNNATASIEASASIWASKLGLGNALFCDLRIGEAFRMGQGADVLRKLTASGWYMVENGTGQKYRTGVRAAVTRF